MESYKKERPPIPMINDALLSRESWKIFQVISEFVEGYERLIHIKPAISVFGSARLPMDHPYYQLAYDIGRTLSDAHFSVITGGGPGLMQAVNKGAYEGKSFSIGLNVALPTPEEANHYQDITLYFRHFFTRKVMFVKYTTAYVVLPGGFGTLNELIEILTLIQTHKTKRIPVLLVKKDFWQGLINWFLDELMKEKMIHPTDMALFKIVETAEEVLAEVKTFHQQDEEDNMSRFTLDL